MSTASVTTSLPLAISLLHTAAAQYPGLQNAQGTTTTVAPGSSSASAASVVASLLSTALSNLPNVQASNTQAQPGSNLSSATSNLCENCHLKPKHNDGKKTHPYCSKSCAQAKASGNCDFCHSRPKYPGHSFCGKACAKKEASRQTGTSKKPPGTCQAPGCQKAAYTNANGTLGEYCSLTHRALSETLCLLCLQNQKMSNSQFCGKNCSDDAEKKGPMILEVPAGHVTYKSVADQFKASWRHPGTTCPQVKQVYKVIATPTSVQAYKDYKSSVEARGQFAASGRSVGNENRRWHGTRRECLLGDKGQTQFCTSTTCSLCCILRTSFDVSSGGKNFGLGQLRFGKGIYTSSTSFKSDGYSRNISVSSTKAMLLNKVVVGKCCKLKNNAPSLTAPPSGCDSVVAEGQGGDYDELIVYCNEAIRPSFLVMYQA